MIYESPLESNGATTAALEFQEYSQQSEVTRLKADQAFNQLVSLTQPRLLSAAVNLVGPDASKDIVQQTYLKAFIALKNGSFRGDSQVETWLYRIMTNNAFSHLYNRETHQVQPLPPDISDNIGLNQAGPEDTIVSLDNVKRINDSLKNSKLSPRDKKIIELLSKGIIYAEIAGAIGLSITATKVAVHRARNRAKEVIENS